MKLTNDYIDFIQLLNENEVPYMVVGGYAVMAHGNPRFTMDFDIWIKPSVEIGKKMMTVLKDFGFVLKGLSEKDFEKDEMVVQLGYEPGRIDILCSISGVSFDEAYPHKVLKKLNNNDIWFIGLKDLIKNKEATGRDQDIVDAKKLRKIFLKQGK